MPAARAAQQAPFDAAVIGAGPAGLAAVATLLDKDPQYRIAWVDPHFRGGRLDIYGEVPSNTKVHLFVKFAEHFKCFGKQSEGLSAFKQLLELDQSRGCNLQYARDLIKQLAHLLQGIFPNLVSFMDSVEQLSIVSDAQPWRLQLASGTVLTAQCVYMATGCKPIEFSGSGPTLIPLDWALSPSTLPHLIQPNSRVAVIGSSHSAVLVLRNLLDIPTLSTVSVLNVHRSPLLYAVDFGDGRIERDNTGLKGIAADWARANLVDCTADQPIVEQMNGRLVRMRSPETCSVSELVATLPELQQCRYIIYAAGYERSRLPRLVVEGKEVSAVVHDYITASLLAKSMEGDKSATAKIPRLQGFGIAFPERIRTDLGEEEMNIGMWKFALYVSRALVPPSRSSSS